eukprot:UN11840
MNESFSKLDKYTEKHQSRFYNLKRQFLQSNESYNRYTQE